MRVATWYPPSAPAVVALRTPDEAAVVFVRGSPPAALVLAYAPKVPNSPGRLYGKRAGGLVRDHTMTPGVFAGHPLVLEQAERWGLFLLGDSEWAAEGRP